MVPYNVKSLSKGMLLTDSCLFVSSYVAIYIPILPSAMSWMRFLTYPGSPVGLDGIVSGATCPDFNTKPSSSLLLMETLKFQSALGMSSLANLLASRRLSTSATFSGSGYLVFMGIVFNPQ